MCFLLLASYLYATLPVCRGTVTLIISYKLYKTLKAECIIRYLHHPLRPSINLDGSCSQEDLLNTDSYFQVEGLKKSFASVFSIVFQ